MPPRAMTDEQRIFFETNGFLVFPNALPPEHLERVRAATDRAEALWRSDPSRPGGRGANLEQVLAPIEYEDELLALLEHPVVFPVVREILGDDVSMVDNDYFITPPRTATHAHWHHDVGMAGVYHPRSVMMVKVFFLLTDVSPEGGGTAVVPGSHRFPMDFKLPHADDPAEMPGHVKMSYPAGTAWLFNGRTYHAALHNSSDTARRVLIYNYGHFWMKPWQGYEPSPAIQAKAATTAMRQLLHIGDAYGQHLKD